MRTFVALPLPEHVQDRLEALQAGLDTRRPVPRENLHLTLAFLDEQPNTVLTDLHSELEAIAVPPFELVLAGLGTFGGERPRTLFVGAKDSPSLVGLQRRVRTAARNADIFLPRERFRPHVTLSRLRDGDPAESRARLAWALRVHSAFAMEPFPVSHFSLYRSSLTPAGPVYETLADYPLGHDGIIRWDGSVPQDF